NTDDETKIESEFSFLQTLFKHVKQEYFPDKPYFNELSIGMSSDYKIALKHGATLIRVGSMIFGER
ncbi:MAG: YggS family pyridoxal phosphate-dependent enzyme, partial [Bacteroidota bacterium]